MANEPIDLRVASSTNIQYLATSIVKYFQEGRRVQISAIGVVPISTAIKALIIANGKVAPEGRVFVMVPYFFTDDVDNRESGLTEQKTVIKLSVYRVQSFDLASIVGT